jgi:hypothetical protein
MIRRSTWILLAIFLLVLAGAWGFRRYQAGRPAQATSTPSTETLLSIEANTLANLRIEDDQGKVLVLGRDVEGLWTIVEPQSEWLTDSAGVESGISQLLSLQSQFTLEMPDDLAKYGLLQPAYQITINLNGGEKHVLLVGSEAPAVSGYYVQLDGGAPRVVSKFSLDPVINMVEKPPYQATETPLPTLETSGTPGVTQEVDSTELPESTATPAP